MSVISGWWVGFVIVAVISAAVYWFHLRHGWLIRAILPAISMLLIGGIVLLGTAQGRDLGSGLLGAPHVQLVAFALALLYWALATWHNARFPIEHAAGLDEDEARSNGWSTWLPRMLGLVVFAIALGHLTIAWQTGAPVPEVLALGGLILATALVYWVLVVYRRRVGKRIHARIKTRAPITAGLLSQIFENRKVSKDSRLTVGLPVSTWLTFGFFLAVAVLITLLSWDDPWAVGAMLGSTALAFVAFGAWLTLIVGLWMIADRLRVRHAAILVPLLLLAVMSSFTRDYHRVRLLDSDDAAIAPAVTTRPSVRDAALDWYAQASQAAPERSSIPMVFVATAGGGIRAAYWTAAVLDELERTLALAGDPGHFRRHLFAVSGVSGGSVGAAFVMAYPPGEAIAGGDRSPALAALANDFLAPTLASLAFVDIPSSILPDLGQKSRGTTLEVAFESASGGRLSAPFLDFVAADSPSAWRPLLLLNSTHQKTGRRLIASQVVVDRATFLDAFDLHALVGWDLRASTAAHNSARFTYVSPAGSLRAPDGTDRGQVIDGGYFENFGAVTMRQLARQSLAAIDAYRQASTQVLPSVQPILIQISSDPGLIPRDRAMITDPDACASGDGTSLPFEPGDRESLLARSQLLAPLRGALATRSAQGILASKELASLACEQAGRGGQAIFAHLAMCETADPPLGWAMSEGARRAILGYLETCDNSAELARIRAGFSEDRLGSAQAIGMR